MTPQAAADEIVEKYRCRASREPKTTDPFWHPDIAEVNNATHCAILEVQACIDLIKTMPPDIANHYLLQYEPLMNELKSRVK